MMFTKPVTLTNNAFFSLLKTSLCASSPRRIFHYYFANTVGLIRMNYLKLGKIQSLYQSISLFIRKKKSIAYLNHLRTFSIAISSIELQY